MDEVLEHIKNMEQWQNTHGVEDRMIHAQTVDRLDAIGNTLTTIETNHLTHLQASYERLDANIYWIKWLVMGLVAGIGAIVVGVLIAIFTKLV